VKKVATIKSLTILLIGLGTMFFIDKFDLQELFVGSVAKQIYVMTAGLTIAMLFAKYIIFATLKIAKVPQQTLSPTEQAVGETIGYVERLLAYCFVLDGSDNAIAMLIAAKGVYRLHELGAGKRPEKQEMTDEEADETDKKADEKTYYIMVGTFSSIAYAILVGFCVRFLLKFV